MRLGNRADAADTLLATHPAFRDPKKLILKRGQFDPLRTMNGVKERRKDNELFRLTLWLRGEEFPQDEAEEILLLAASHCDPEFDEAEALKKVENAYNRYEPNEVPEEEGEEAVEGKQAVRIIRLAMADAEEQFPDQYKNPHEVISAFTAVLIKVDPAVNSWRGQTNLLHLLA